MLNFFCAISDKGWAQFIVRWILGLLFLMRGWHKVFDVGTLNFAQNAFVNRYAESWIPEPLLWTLGAAFPPVELIGGILVCIGLFTRETAIALGTLLIVTTYGHTLRDPFFNIDGTTFTMLVMIVFVLLMPRDEDKLTVNAWRTGRNAG